MELSVVITLLNEEDNIRPLFAAIRKALTHYDYELILVNDGSTDSTVSKIKAEADHRTKLVSFNRNYGQTAAMAAGIDHAQGEYIVTMDGDLQNDPSDIPAMLMKLKSEGWDVVAGNRKNRQDGLLWRRIPSRIANRMIRNLTGVFIRDYGCTLKVFTRDIAQRLGLYGELHRFIPILAVLQGGKIADMDVNHHARIHGKSKYGIGRTLKVASDLMLMVFFQKYFRRPIHLFGPIGIISFLIGFAINFYLLVLKIMGQDIWGRPILILGASLILAGIQFLTFGLIAELIMRTYYESQNKKTYTIREVFTGSRPSRILEEEVSV
ncbi:glycosyltransferase family 2 protein [Ohtaekwangia koreensis]|uniref:Glycosyltransferase involved in cell wall bisynthesis n=1 Tax=Ohtaekwangia koreensis TaxID=688867 RepID=A0A1T5MEI7_9BACT|nr:glycosyltransferase family 2 protein [Ohtaekwangia koreensis]SKC86617.1 Glycosyltransferase involved in cell wall bisynthesis [Ohtaekwangia koreensis]